jgi:pimeloyl-ACP methyl ester carboxylesterase
MPTHITADGSEMHYRQRGAGPCALFVHAITVDGTLWLDQLNGLSDIRRCVAPDLLGHGLSDPDPARLQPTSRYAKTIIDFVDQQTEGPIDVVGFSAGGVIGALLYEARPARVRSLTLISTGFPKTAPTVNTHDEIAQMLMNEGKDAYYRRLTNYLMAPSASLFTRARYRSMIARTPYETIVSLMADTPTEPCPDLPGKLKLPILMPIGEFDHMAKSPNQDLSGPHVTVEIFANAARLVPIEQPDRLNASLRRFWTSF